MMKKTNSKPGPKADRLVLTGNWEQAVAKMLKRSPTTDPKKETAPKKRTK